MLNHVHAKYPSIVGYRLLGWNGLYGLEKDPQAAARAEAIQPDSFLRKMSEAGRDTRVSAMESTSVEQISSSAS